MAVTITYQQLPFSVTLVPMNTIHECILSPTEIIRYRIHGHGPKKLVLVHGLAARSETWTDLIPLFPAEQYTLYLFDLLGSGESSKPKKADYSMAAHSLRMIEFLEKSKLQGVTLIGHSMGGAIVLLTAIEAMQTGKDHLLTSIVIIGGPGYIQRLPLIAEVFQWRLAGALFVALYSPEAWITTGLQAAYFNQALIDREHIARYAPCYRERASKRALVRTCRQLVPPDYERITGLYVKLSLPVLLLWGRQDRIVPISQGERLYTVIPGAKLEIIEECGHNPQEEKPEQTYQIISQFLDNA